MPVGGVVEDGWRGVCRQVTGETRFHLSTKSIMVWGSFTNLSLGLGRFWLGLTIFLSARKWPMIEGAVKVVGCVSVWFE